MSRRSRFLAAALAAACALALACGGGGGGPDGGLQDAPCVGPGCGDAGGDPGPAGDDGGDGAGDPGADPAADPGGPDQAADGGDGGADPAAEAGGDAAPDGTGDDDGTPGGDGTGDDGTGDDGTGDDGTVPGDAGDDPAPEDGGGGDPGEDPGADPGQDPGGDAPADAGADLPPDDGGGPPDLCPLDPLKTDPGACGCGVPDTPRCAEVDPPLPDPPGWAEPPHATGPTSVAMRVEALADASGVEVLFQCVAGPCHDSGWQDGDAYEDTGLAPGVPCTWRVMARDRSPNANATGWSPEATAAPDLEPGLATGLQARFFDLDPPPADLPDLDGRAPGVARVEVRVDHGASAAPWAGLGDAYADGFASRHAGFLHVAVPGDYTLALLADDCGLLWLDGEPLLQAPCGQPPAEVRATRTLAAGFHPLRLDHLERDGDAALVLSWEGPGIPRQPVPPTALYRPDPPDRTPPDPSPAAFQQPPVATGTGSVRMVAADARDPAAVRYRFEAVEGGGPSSGWQSSREFQAAGFAPGARVAYRVRVRDLSLDGNEGLPSPAAACRTDTFVPDVAGMDRPAALQALVAAGLALGDQQDVYSDTVPSGVVVSQDPAPGTPVPGGSAVSLVVSRGPRMVGVPDVRGMVEAKALALLAEAGLAPATVTRRADCEVAAGTVAVQQPPAGSLVRAGTASSLVVSRGPDRAVITELMYHPADDTARQEFLELHNPCPQPLDLSGWIVNGLGGFAFPAGARVDPLGHVVLAQDAAAFQAAWGFPPDFAWADASLSNAGERLQVLTALGAVADEVSFDDVPPWPVTPDGLGPSLEVVDPAQDNATPRNWHACTAPAGATPRAVNSVDARGLPPWITGVGHGTPAPGVPIAVTATVEDADTVVLTYVLDWGAPQALPMADDGLSGDGAAGDGVHGALLPGQPEGTLVRYRVDAAGPTGLMGFPRDDDTVQWTGTYLAPPVASGLPVMHWLMEPDAYARALEHRFTDLTEPALLYHDGVLHDGLQVRVRGQSSRNWPKKHWNFKFPQGHGFAAPGFVDAPVDGFNLQSSYADKSYLREVLSYETFRDAGCPSHVILPLELHQNGQFFGLYSWLEDKDQAWLERNGLDPEGGLYKAFASQCTWDPEASLEGPWEKVEPDDGDYSELAVLLQGINTLTGQERRDFIFDSVDLPAMLSYHAASVLIHNNDQVAKNYFLYRDRRGTGRWSMQAWDMDLTFGRSFQGTVLNDQIFADVDVVPGRQNVSPSHPLFGDSEHQKWDYLWNRLTDALLEDPDIRAMYHRRLRTLMDDLLAEGRYEARIDALAARVASVAEADRQKWGWYGAEETPARAVERLKAEYLAVRRTHLFATHRVEGEIPEAQSPTPPVVIHELMYNPFDDPADPADPGDELEFVELFNPSPTESVDLSGWQVSGVGLTLPAGAVILPGGYLLAVRNDVAFRAAHGPGRYVAAQYAGKLDGAGERVALLDRAGNLVDQVTYDDGPPWPAAPDGNGPSLELIDPALDNALPASWAASTVPGGTPGARNSVSPPP